MKCSKCITYFRLEKERSEMTQDLKAKSESMHHASLKNKVCNMLRQIAKEGEYEESSVDTEVSVEGIGKVDVVGQIGDVKVAVECGITSLKKINLLKEHFDVVIHIPYCYTWDFYNINIEKIHHEIFASSVFKSLKRGWPTEEILRNKVICLEEGECSLPSGRDGYPKEAMQIAGLTIDQVKEKNTEKL